MTWFGLGALGLAGKRFWKPFVWQKQTLLSDDGKLKHPEISQLVA
jgi:hypothetical protein